MTRVIDSLVSGEYFYPVLVWERHRTLRFQEGVFSKRRCILLRYHILGIRNRFLRIPSRHMPALTEISFGVNLWSVLRHRLCNRCNGLQLLIADLNQFLGFLQYLPRLSHHKTDRISHTPGNAAFGNHHIPVLLEMADLVIRNIFRGQNRQHPRQFQSF